MDGSAVKCVRCEQLTRAERRIATLETQPDETQLALEKLAAESSRTEADL